MVYSIPGKRNYNLLPLLSIDQSHRRIAVELDLSPALTTIANAFSRNIDRIGAFGTFPIFLTYGSGLLARLSVEASLAIAKQLQLTPEQQQDPEIMRRINNYIERRWKQEMQLQLNDRVAHDTAILASHDTVLRLVQMLGPLLEPAIDAMLSTCLMDTWTAFHSLVAALKSFTRNTGTFRNAFGKPEIEALLSDPELGWSAAIRNVLVHKAGKADAEFRNAVAGHPILSTINEGEDVLLDGELVTHFVGLAQRHGRELLRHVQASQGTN